VELNQKIIIFWRLVSEKPESVNDEQLQEEMEAWRQRIERVTMKENFEDEVEKYALLCSIVHQFPPNDENWQRIGPEDNSILKLHNLLQNRRVMGDNMVHSVGCQRAPTLPLLPTH